MLKGVLSQGSYPDTQSVPRTKSPDLSQPQRWSAQDVPEGWSPGKVGAGPSAQRQQRRAAPGCCAGLRPGLERLRVPEALGQVWSPG